jgi:glycosyltransferase involved in cell wall biosynthesis
MQSKIIQAPLLGRCPFPENVTYERNPVFTVGTVGGEPLRKGYLYLLEAWKKLALPHAKLLIRSDFTGYPVLEELAASMPSVELIGYMPDIAGFYRKCDLFVLPSVDDGFGMALYEAMANGVPAIATTHCGSSELLASGRDAVIIEPMSTDQLAHAILSLYESEELRRQMARNGRDAIASIIAGETDSSYSDSILRLLQEMSFDTGRSMTAAV